MAESTRELQRRRQTLPHVDLLPLRRDLDEVVDATVRPAGRR